MKIGEVMQGVMKTVNENKGQLAGAGIVGIAAVGALAIGTFALSMFTETFKTVGKAAAPAATKVIDVAADVIEKIA